MPQRATNMKRDVLVMNLEEQIVAALKEQCGKSIEECSYEELYYALLRVSKDLISATEKNTGEKRVYYLSAEFLPGRLLLNNLVNMGVFEIVGRILEAHGKDLRLAAEYEKEPALGNGGMGRLASCYLDSAAALGIPAEGIGLNYHFGLFKQTIVDGLQKEEKDSWRDVPNWEKSTELSFEVHFGDRIIRSRMYDIDVVGYSNGLNRMRLFDADSVDDSIVGDGITFDEKNIDKNLTLFLYPDNSTKEGKYLRIYQEYFLVSNAAQLILHEMKARQYDLRKLYNYAIIQINDTHPSLIIPELIRILVDEKAFTIDEAIEVVEKTCAYTNHSIMDEAREKWPISYLEDIVPQLVPIIKYLDTRTKIRFDDSSVWIIDENQVANMAALDIHYCFSVNGVAEIHTNILKEKELHNFYKIYPEKFNNKTNGITPRRWMYMANRQLSQYISSLISDAYKEDAEKLQSLLNYIDDETVLEEISNIKLRRKQFLCDYISENEHIELDPNGIFDIHAMRIHEYKRQFLNALYIIHRYLEIKRGLRPARPLNVIAGGKAAASYELAKDSIHLFKVLETIVNNDPEVSPYMKVVFATDYNISLTEKLISAGDISEQLSLASTEASGTGSLMYMMGGAITLGTEDGAGMEIHRLVGDECYYVFGMDAVTASNHLKNGDYHPSSVYYSSETVREAVDFIIGPQAMAAGHRENLERIHYHLTQKDTYMALADLEDYIRVRDRMICDYEDRIKWEKMMLVNIAKSGWFSSDRSVQEYNRDIWHIS